MPDLIDRLAKVNDDRPRIPLHSFTAGLQAYISGLQTAKEVRNQFELRGRERLDFDRMIAAIDGKTTENKILYLLAFEGIALKLEDDKDRVYRNSVGQLKKNRIRIDLEIY